jgi:hypothetical protein
MLMSRDSRPIWRAARGSFPDLPPCPPDLSEPEYARLVFDRDCHVSSPKHLTINLMLNKDIVMSCPAYGESGLGPKITAVSSLSCKFVSPFPYRLRDFV